MSPVACILNHLKFFVKRVQYISNLLALRKAVRAFCWPCCFAWLIQHSPAYIRVFVFDRSTEARLRTVLVTGCSKRNGWNMTSRIVARQLMQSTDIPTLQIFRNWMCFARCFLEHFPGLKNLSRKAPAKGFSQRTTTKLIYITSPTYIILRYISSSTSSHHLIISSFYILRIIYIIFICIYIIYSHHLHYLHH